MTCSSPPPGIAEDILRYSNSTAGSVPISPTAYSSLPEFKMAYQQLHDAQQVTDEVMLTPNQLLRKQLSKLPGNRKNMRF